MSNFEQFEQIEAMHRQVREFVEDQEPNYLVLSVDNHSTTAYEIPLHALGERPYPILSDIQARFRVSARHKTESIGSIMRRLVCDVWVTRDGKLMMGDRLESK